MSRPGRRFLFAESTPLLEPSSRPQQIEKLLRQRFRREWILSGNEVAIDDDVRAPGVGALGVLHAESLQFDLEHDRKPSINSRLELLDVRETGDSIPRE